MISSLILILFSLVSDVPASLCQEISVELKEAMESEIISERDYREIMEGCYRYEDKPKV